MRVVKRAFSSIKHNMIKNVGFVLMFTVIFSLTISAVVLYMSTKEQVDTLKLSLDNAVTISYTSIKFKAENRIYNNQFKNEDDIKSFLDSEYIEDYNFTSYNYYTLNNTKPLYPKEYKKNKAIAAISSANEVLAYAPVNTKYDIAFTVNGFQLLEGRHFTEADGDSQICMVSKEFAELNNLSLGSVIDTTTNQGDKLELVVEGIFKAPESIKTKGIGVREEEWIIVPELLTKTYNVRGEHVPLYISAFLKDKGMIPAFCEEVKEKFNVIDIRQSHFEAPSYSSVPEKYAEMEMFDAFEEMDKNPECILYLDSEYYDMVAAPLEKVNTLALYMTIAIAAVSIIILILVSMLTLKNKKREIAILLSMGESKVGVISGVLMELLLPVLLSVLLGVFIGVSLGIPIVNNIGTSVFKQTELLAQGANDVATYAQMITSETSSDIVDGGGMDILARFSYNVSVFPNPEPIVSAAVIFAYLIFSLLAIILSVVIQLAFVLRIKPARILTGRG